MTKIVYFSEPIDFATFSDIVEVQTRAQSLQALIRNGAKVYRPGTAWVHNEMLPGSAEISPEDAVALDGINRSAMAEADVLVARLPSGQESHGVPMEIEYATNVLGIPAIVYTERPGVALLGNPKVTVVKNVPELETAYVNITKAMPRKVAQLHYTGDLRQPHYPGDAGIDLRAQWDVVVPAGKSVLIPTGSSLQIPEGMFGHVIARSSTFQNFGVLVLPGIIDEGYTGELYVNAFNPTDADSQIEVGERVAQILLVPNMRYGTELVKVDALEARDRGSNGFGSTDR